MEALALDILTTAAILFVVSTGLMIILGVMKLINFAHGAFLTTGGYIAYLVGAAGSTHGSLSGGGHLGALGGARD